MQQEHTESTCADDLAIAGCPGAISTSTGSAHSGPCGNCCRLRKKLKPYVASKMNQIPRPRRIMACDGTSSLRRSMTTVCLNGLFLLAMIPFRAGAAQFPLGRIDPEETERTCGRRSLFVLLRLVGCELRYDDLLGVVPVNASGSSMADLVEGAKPWGCRLEPKHGEMSSLLTANLPLIAHIWVDREQRSIGHYVVVVRRDAARIHYIDASVGRAFSSTIRQFSDSWSGYVLVPVDNTAFWLALLTAANATLVLVTFFWAGVWHRVRAKRATMAAALLAILGLCGCSPESRGVARNSPAGSTTATELRQSEKAAKALATSVRLRDVGTVAPGTEARAVFTLTNTSKKPVELSLGEPSCGCMGAKLDEEVVAPGNSTNLNMMLSTYAGTEAGPRNATVQLGLVGSDERYLFTVRGILEGLIIDPYSIRVPSKLEGFAPDPIEGQFIIGDTSAEGSAIRDVRLIEENGGDGSIVGALRLGTPRLDEEETLRQYKVRRFSIPISLRGNAVPKSGLARLLVVYRIGKVVSENSTQVRVFPRAEATSQ